MSVAVVAVFGEPKNGQSIKIGEKELLPMLGPSEDAVAVQLSELLGAVKSALAQSIDVESDLTVEISGSVTLKVEGGMKYIFFNVGGSSQSANTMKVSLKTKLSPHSDSD